MKTTLFSIANYCVPCHAHCRYCLLASCGKATGVDYKAGETFAAGVIRDMKEARPDLPCSYYTGYCMDAFAPAVFIESGIRNTCVSAGSIRRPRQSSCR